MMAFQARKRPTLADIARSAGVSLMTVSRAVNNKPGVGEEMRQNILALASEMGYRPNQIARGLATNRTSMVGLVVPDNTNPFFAHIARGVEQVAGEQGYNVFLLNTSEDAGRELAALDSLWQKDIDGVILCSSRLDLPDLEEQISHFPAVVLVNREISGSFSNVVTINVDDRLGAQLAVRHFLGQGRQHIACISGPAHSLSAQRRLEGYRSALQAAGLSLDAQLEACCAPDTDGGRAAAAALLQRRLYIDAMYAFNDLAAVGAMQVCQESGRQVPGEIAIIGSDDIPLATIIRPQLTTLHVDLGQIGRLAMHALLELIQGEAPQASILIEPELIVRASA
jgi:LacI family transcriptional regulator